MFSIEELFEARVTFANRLQQYMEINTISKAELSEMANVSRPTLNKILTGDITNKVNFAKHTEKILSYLDITPDQIMGNVSNPFNHFQDLRKSLHISNAMIAEQTGISIPRLEEIERGEKADLSELRDIAFCCETSVRCLCGTYFFEPPLSSICRYDEEEVFSGFWGHVGILLSHKEDYLWYPITQNVHRHIVEEMNQDYIIIPCMDNHLLLLNMSYVDTILLLDDACDQPGFTNWDPGVREGMIPLVVYEALEDWYYEMDEHDQKLISDKLKSVLQALTEDKHWDDMDIEKIVNGIEVYYGNGNILETFVDFNDENTIGLIAQELYEFGDVYEPTERLVFSDTGGVEVITSMKRIAMVQLPLLKTEDCICRGYE